MVDSMADNGQTSDNMHYGKRDERILELATKIHGLVFSLYEELQGDVSAGECALELAKTMFKHFGSPTGDNRGRTSNSQILRVSPDWKVKL